MKSARVFISAMWNSSTFTTWGNFLINSLKLLVITPVILAKFNVDQIAIWFLFMTVITLSNMADMGFAPTFSRLVSFVYGGIGSFKEVNRRNENRNDFNIDWVFMGRLYGNIGSVYIILAALALLLMATLGTWSMVVPISRTANPDEFWMSWIVVCILVVSNFFGKKYENCLLGMNYVSLVNRWNIFFNICSVIASIAILLLGGKIMALVLVLLAFSMLNIFRNHYLLTRKVEKGIFGSFKAFSIDKDILLHAWSPAWRSALGIVCSTGIVQATGIMYSQVADSTQLASYLLTLKLITSCSVFSQAPFYSKLPVFARLRARGEIRALSGHTKRSMQISLFTFVSSTFMVGLFGNLLLNVIHSEVMLVDSELWFLMTAIWFLERHHAMHAQIYSTTNHIPFYIPIIISGIINLGIVLLLIGPLRIWAFPIAHGVSNLLINNWWNVRISLRSIDERFFGFFRNSALFPSISMLVLNGVILFTSFQEKLNIFILSLKDVWS